MPSRQGRRRSVATASGLFAACATAPAAMAISPGPVTVALKPLTNISNPAIDLTNVGDDRLFIAGQGSGTNAQVRLFKNNTLVSTPFLDLNLGGVTPAATGEKGLLGIAFHPDFNAPVGTPGRGKFYTYTSEAKNTSVTPDFSHPELGTTGGDHDGVIREWTVDLSANPDKVDCATPSREVMRFREPQNNHNGGAIKFGPDGYLYLALGDGGGGNDYNGSVSSTTDGHSNPAGNGQTLISSNGTTNVYGKILRIDPLAPAAKPASADPVSANGNYRVPAANPFTNAGARTEVFAYGLRNPFRFSFDRLTGSLYAGDVGQGLKEEVDVVASGGNYGWPYKEGTTTTSPRTVPPGFTSLAPLAEYAHPDGTAIIGGFVYRGANIPELYGKYVFGDLGVSGIGQLFYMDAGGGTVSAFSYYSGSPTTSLYSFGEASNGELFALFANGSVSKILGKQWNAAGGGSWATAGNWIGPVPNALDTDANFLAEITSPTTVTLDGNRLISNLLFNSSAPYTIAQGTGGTLTVNRLTTAPTIRVLSGTHTISAPLVAAGNPKLTIAAGASLTLSGAVTGKFGIPSIDPSGKLDLKTNDLIVDYGPAVASPLPTLRQLIATGYNGGAWGGNGITTSAGTPGTGLAYVEAARLFSLTGGQTATWNGQTVDATAVLIKFTWYGDLNLDGVVDPDDYALMDKSFAAGLPPATAAEWADGDFNYDGLLTPADYLLMDTAFGIQTGPLSPAFLSILSQRESQFGTEYISQLLSNVPEPSLAGGLFAGLLLRRTRHPRQRPLADAV